jgi:hypothetical protein
MSKLWKATKYLSTAAKLRTAEKLASGGDVVSRTIIVVTVLIRAMNWITGGQAMILFAIGVGLGICAWLASGRMRTAAHT